MWTTFKARYRIVTPLFCGGADPENGQPELRPASVRGMLRWWWRAISLGRFQGNLEKLRKQEFSLFGAANRKINSGSRVSLRVALDNAPHGIPKGSVLKIPGTGKVVGHGVRYFGYGLMHAFGSKTKGYQAGQLTRPCLAAPISFTVHLRCRFLDACERDTLTEALKAWGLLGGLGARSRRGWGSVNLEALWVDEQKVFNHAELTSLSDLSAAIEELSGWRWKGDPAFSALSQWGRVVLAETTAASSLDALDAIGCEMVRYRSWGHNGRLFGGKEPAERNFKEDHDLMKRTLSQRNRHPKRVGFGLPHNYGKKVSDKVEAANPKTDRRASPLLIHVHELASKWVVVLCYLEGAFLPSTNPMISVGGKAVPLDATSAAEAVTGFLDRIAQNPKDNRIGYTLNFAPPSTACSDHTEPLDSLTP